MSTRHSKQRWASAAVLATAALLLASAAQAQRGRFDEPRETRGPQRIDCGAAPSGPARASAQGSARASAQGSAQADNADTADASGDSAALCAVDVGTYVGWRVFNLHCATCHAADAAGSTFAPDLTFRMAEMERTHFFSLLDDGYLGAASQIPPRGENSEVALYYEELWAYLSARASGALPAGPLEPLRETAIAE